MASRFRARFNLALAGGLALVLAIGIAAYVAIDAFLEDAQDERSSLETVLLVERTVLQLKSAESWQRKFIITTAPEDLKEYQAATVHVAHALQRLRKADLGPGQRDLLAQLEAVIEQRMRLMEVAVHTRRESGLEAAGALVGNASNSALRTRIDLLAERIRAGEIASVNASRAQTVAGGRVAKRLLAAGGLATVAALGWAIFLVNVYAERRRGAERGLAESVAQLERMGAALRASEAQLRQVLDAVPVLFGYVDAGERMRFHNRAYELALGRPPEEIRGRTLREVLGGKAYEGIRHHVERAMQGHVVTYERQHRHAEGSLHDYEMKYFPRFGEGADETRVVGVYAMGTDITEFKRVDRMKSEFVATVSHELRTPLTSIRGSLGLIAGGVAGPMPDKAKQLVDIARQSCERLVRLVNDILDIERLEAGQMPLEIRPVPLRPLLERAIADHSAFAAQHDVALVLAAPDGELAASVDADRFLQVMTNLLSNAVRFSPRAGVVELRLAKAGGLARLEVSDRGPGIPDDFRSRIFGKFTQADSSSSRKKSGSGLGLSISRALVERMGGEIGFASSEEGTTFFVDLPLAQASMEEA
ncbi:MAG: PAS domain-containing protein [Burkholderiales bacterium]|nr:PAS domain-containing protein [Burkholderiales bacterium]